MVTHTSKREGKAESLVYTNRNVGQETVSKGTTFWVTTEMKVKGSPFKGLEWHRTSGDRHYSAST
jgi:hypothetical protein